MSWWGWFGVGIVGGVLSSVIAVCIWAFVDDMRPHVPELYPIICPGCGVEGVGGPRRYGSLGFRYIGHTCEECYHKCMVALGKEW